MKSADRILQIRAKIIPELISWVETYNPENILYNKNSIAEAEEEHMIQVYDHLQQVIERLKANQCTMEDYEVISFQLEQMRHDEI
ncbi:MAG: hypothetical protein PSX81_05175 [bacterium]|nr:hypothetical protein [bacterium]